MDYYRSTATRNLMQAVAGEPDGIPILDVNVDPDVLFPKGAGFGHDPSQYVPDMMAAPLSMQTYKPSEWDAIYDEQEAKQNSLEHLYLEAGWVNLDQNGDGYCWAYGPAHAIMLRRMAMHLPHVRLNPHSVASLIKGGRNEGGWCGLSLAKYRDIGCAEEGNGPTQWPKQQRGASLNKRWDNPDFKAAALKFKVTDDWYDIGKPAYSQKLKAEQLFTCGAKNEPGATDWNDWVHDIAFLRMVRIEKGHWAPLILNSWFGWGRRGLAVLSKWNTVTVATGVQCHVPDGAIAVVSSTVA